MPIAMSDGGVYIELEAIALSRDIPFSLRWLIDPIFRRISRSSLVISLQQTEDAVLSGTHRLSRPSAGPDNVPGINALEPAQFVPFTSLPTCLLYHRLCFCQRIRLVSSGTDALGLWCWPRRLRQ
jgi:hypothetical protein